VQGKVALVTGGSSGIGLATALAFAKAGVRVAIASRSKTKAGGAVRAIEQCGGEGIWLQADVSHAVHRYGRWCSRPWHDLGASITRLTTVGVVTKVARHHRARLGQNDQWLLKERLVMYEVRDSGDVEGGCRGDCE
jgi:NAD(P)-dependent dehydrogenase (short-subunit alcohol dehydrogenase family)